MTQDLLSAFMTFHSKQTIKKQTLKLIKKYMYIYIFLKTKYACPWDCSAVYSLYESPIHS